MANTVSYVSYSHSANGNQDYVSRFVAKFTGSYTNGTPETVIFTGASNANGLEGPFLPNSSLAEGIPDFVANLGGYTVNVSNYSDGWVGVTFYSAAGTELESGNYPAGITDGQITFEIHSKG